MIACRRATDLEVASGVLHEDEGDSVHGDRRPGGRAGDWAEDRQSGRCGRRQLLFRRPGTFESDRVQLGVAEMHRSGILC